MPNHGSVSVSQLPDRFLARGRGPISKDGTVEPGIAPAGEHAAIAPAGAANCPSDTLWAPPSLSAQSLLSALTRPDPVLIKTEPGKEWDGMDELVLVKDIEGKDDEEFWERLRADAQTDPDISKLFDVYNLWGSPAELFEQFYNLGVAQSIAELMRRFGITEQCCIADVGCGWGWLPFSLDRLGYKDLVAMEPSNAVRHLKEATEERIEIVTDLDCWRSIRHRFDALVSVATIHHWDHIPWIALEARRTMKSGAFWFVVMEWFADTPAEFIQAMETHPTRVRYHQYEWAYPVTAYVDLIQSVGFSLSAVIPFYYRNNSLLTVGSQAPTPDTIDQEQLNDLVDQHLTGENGTVEMFWAEVDANRRRPNSYKLFTRPQVLVFRRVEVSPVEDGQPNCT
ncbi:MAG: hypothetical protein DCF24_02155 [Cyanobium sp.]|nr:MAG: hypothetical protein DCF24_02155 [Cyanobium sp.]